MIVIFIFVLNKTIFLAKLKAISNGPIMSRRLEMKMHTFRLQMPDDGETGLKHVV
jgi:hypothetical protein